MAEKKPRRLEKTNDKHKQRTGGAATRAAKEVRRVHVDKASLPVGLLDRVQLITQHNIPDRERDTPAFATFPGDTV